MTQLAVGMMSGTSADGVSLALCSFSGKQFKLIHYKTYPYPSTIAKKIISASAFKTPALSQLNFELGNFFAAKAKRFILDSKVSKVKIRVIASHGQTVYHGPNDIPANTLQIGEPGFIAEQTGIPVVADFRPRDVAAGGEGAPLIPYFDDYFFGGRSLQALQNIGGISNVTILGKGQKTIAFDNGPGNCLMDWAVSKITKSKKSYDRNGAIASRGFIDQKSIKQMAKHPFFHENLPNLRAGSYLTKTSSPGNYLKRVRKRWSRP